MRTSPAPAGAGPEPSAASPPTVTVVVASKASAASLDACLSALEAQRDGVQALVYTDGPSPFGLRERFAWARFLETPDALVPHMWRDGIIAAEGAIVALTIGQMVPAADWVERIREAHARYDAVAGAIDPGDGLRLVDWAECFSRYSRDMRPFPAHSTVDLPGDNAAYKRALLHRYREAYADGFWEPVVHRRMEADGIVLWQSPDIVVRQGRSAGFAAFARQRLVHGRLYGHQRGAHFGPARNLAGVLGSPLVPFLMTLRVLSRVGARRRHRGRVVAALPYVFAFNAAWAYAEARGHLDMLRR